MRLPRVRFTVRRMMVAVAIAGLLMAGWEYRRLGQLSQDYQLRVVRHRREEAMWLKSHGRLSAARERAIAGRSFVEVSGHQVILGATDGTLDAMREEIERESRRVEYHRAMGLKYERAARSPWLPVEPDSSEP